MAFAQPHRAAPVWYRYGIRVIHRICSCFSPSMAITPTLPEIKTNSFVGRTCPVVVSGAARRQTRQHGAI